MSIEKGAILEGKVVNITAFGAFIEIEGKTGLVHISEVSTSYVKDIKEVLKLGDVVKVKVLNMDESGKISLSIRQAMDNYKENVRPERSERQERAPKFEKSERSERPERTFKERDYRQERNTRLPDRGPQTFEDMMSRFQKDSEEKMAEFKRRTEAGGNKKRRT